MTTLDNRIINAERLLNELAEQIEELQHIDIVSDMVNNYEGDIDTLRDRVKGLERRIKVMTEILKRVSQQRERPGT